MTNRPMDTDLLPAPSMPVALPPGPNEHAYLIHRSDRQSNLEVVIEEVWPDHVSFGETQVRLYWGADHVDTQTLPAFFDPQQYFPLHLSVPANKLLTPGEFGVRYEVISANVIRSNSVWVLIDTVAPNYGEPGEVLDFAGIPQLITEQVLADNGQQLTATTTWEDIRYGDELFWFWINTHAPATELRLEEADGRVYVIDPSRPVQVVIPGELVRQRQNGLRSCIYRFRDRSGYSGDVSKPKDFEVALAAAPVLLPPEIPRAQPDGLIDLEDARSGVEVEVPLIAHASPGDEVEAFWNGQTLGKQRVASAWPLRFPVSWAVLSLGALDNVIEAPVRYQWRPLSGVGAGSPVVTVHVNITVAGPGNPENPGPVNPRLPLPVVLGKTADNHLVEEDIGFAAQVRITLHPQLLVDQWLGVYWGAHTQAFEHQLTATDISRGEVVIEVPWPIVEAQPNHEALPVFYHTFNGFNYQHSPSASVLVELSLQRDLPAATFPDADRNLWINCNSEWPPYRGIRIKVEGGAHLQIGDRVRLSWQGCRNTNGSAPIAETAIDLDKDQPLSADEVRDGFVLLLLPFSPFIELPGEVPGSGLVSYRITRSNGRRHYSQLSFVRVSIVYPGGTYCRG
jgi:hypothetical protein